MSTPIVPTLRDNASPNFSALPFSFFRYRLRRSAQARRRRPGAVGNQHHLGIGVSMAVYLAAGVSGAHLNPAVTIALWLFGTFERHRVPAYILAQVAGAFCSAALVYGLYSSLFFDFEQAQQMVRGSVESLELASIFSTYPHASLSFGQAFLVEVVITAILLAMIMAITDDGNGSPSGPLALC